MTRRCSHCSNNGHNSRTCPNKGGVKLFGVRLIDGPTMKKSASMGNLSSLHYPSSAVSPNPSSPSSDPLRESTPVVGGYVSDDPAHASCSSNCRSERKKGNPWTEEEHRLFLMGLQKLGKGDWRGIARNFVISRTPTQVASHAQKYFIRQANATRRKRRSSLFDMVPDMSIDTPTVPEEPEPFLLHCSQSGETEHVNLLPPVSLSFDQDSEMNYNETPTEAEGTFESSNCNPSFNPEFFPARYIPIPFPFWPQNLSTAEEEKGSVNISRHEILKPKPILSKDNINLDELVGLSKLTLGEAATGQIEPSPLSIKLIGAPSRQSAFHANTPVNRSNLSKTKSNNAIHAI